jgi:hypothetical protein
MQSPAKGIAYSCLVALVALYVVGVVSHGLLRHIVQTLPLWFPIIWGFRQRELAKWSALPCFALWLPLMVSIWLFLLGWAHIITGHFSPTEVAMTVVVGIACLAGIVLALRWRTSMSPWVALGTLVLFGALQVLALRVSVLPQIAHR